MNPEAKHLDASIVLRELPIIPWNSIHSNGDRWICIGYAQVVVDSIDFNGIQWNSIEFNGIQ